MDGCTSPSIRRQQAPLDLKWPFDHFSRPLCFFRLVFIWRTRSKTTPGKKKRHSGDSEHSIMEIGMRNNGVEEEKNNERVSLSGGSPPTSTAAAAAVRVGLLDEQWQELIGREGEAQQLALPKVVKCQLTLQIGRRL